MLPLGSYAFLEYYCEDNDCDCRRVLIEIRSQDDPENSLATINYGWESEAFYTEWMHGDAEAGREIASASLDPLLPQSEWADLFLSYFQEEMITRPDYVDRLMRHYDQVKQALLRPQPVRVGRNEPCPCGSGRKFKKCCGAANPHRSSRIGAGINLPRDVRALPPCPPEK